MKPGRRTATALSVLVSGGLLAALYRAVDVRLVAQALLGADWTWVAISVAMIVPITFLRALRFYWIAPRGALPGITEAFRLTCVASALNVFIPAKAGDLVKSYFVAKRSDTHPGMSVAVIVYERLCDLFGLFCWCVAGWLIGRPQVPGLPSMFWIVLAVLGGVCGVLIASDRAAAAAKVLLKRTLPHRKLKRVRDLAHGWPDLLRDLQGRRRWIISFSLLLWLTHLTQIWMFTVALNAHVPFTICASVAAIALMAGQVPLTIGGVGTRDVALVVLLSGYMAPETAAALGVLMATRNLLPPLLGVPVMRPYLSTVVGERQRWRHAVEQAPRG